ncbi:MAG: YdcF family protein [Lachnospiraceae bacterium]|nr:YdcF family protein [Lachnospiraceae bacterium]
MRKRIKPMLLRAIIAVLLFIAAFACIKYSFTIAAVGSGSKFFIFWDVCGAILILLGISVFTGFFSHIPTALKVIFFSLTGIIAVLFIVIVSLIYSCYKKEAPQGLDYIIVLGAQVRSDGPSVVLSFRLESALDYLRANPDTKCVVSGAQGSNEPCTEASAMRDWLVSRGIEKDRILLEENAVNTRQNISYSKELIPEGSTIGIVTNRFHMYRALYLCRKFGIDDPQPVNAPSLRKYELNNVVREFFGVLKDFIF